MTDLEMQLTEIDRKRAQLEIMINSMPHNTHCCGGCERDELEDELRALWAVRNDIARQLKGNRGAHVTNSAEAPRLVRQN